MKDLLRKISNANGPSGSENEVGEIVRKELKGCCDDIKEDVLGNIICHRKGSKPAVMLDAHMDQIGLVIKSITDDGFLKFVKMGGIDDRTLVSQRVKILGKTTMVGVIGAKPPHLLEEDEQKKVMKAKEMYIDAGFKDKKEAEKFVSIGDYAVFDMEFAEMHNDFVTGRSLDNRAGLAVMIKAMQMTKSKNEIYAVASVQEEIGSKGARTSAFGIDPDIAIVLDTTTAGDYPYVKGEDVPVKLNGGPSFTYVEAGGRGTVADRKLVDWLIGVAKRNKIKYQLEVGDGGATDGTMIQLTKCGVRTAVVSVPERYLHGPVEVVSMKDVEDAAKLVARALESVPK
ncbi:MAG: M42 family metallopeptidase [archaeon]